MIFILNEPAVAYQSASVGLGAWVPVEVIILRETPLNMSVAQVLKAPPNDFPAGKKEANLLPAQSFSVSIGFYRPYLLTFPTQLIRSASPVKG